MSVRVLHLFAVLCAVLITGCSKSARPLYGARAKQSLEQVWLVSNGFHTSIALRAKDAPTEMQAFDPKAKYFVVGWGGRDIYMMRSVKPWQWFTAMFLPCASALHVIPVRTSLVKECPNSEVIEFDVTRRGIAKLRNRLGAALARDKQGKPRIAGQGKVAQSRFFEGTEWYYIPKTCNLWAAANLDAAGVPIRVFAAVAADNLIWQGRQHGRVLAVWKRPQDPL